MAIVIIVIVLISSIFANNYLSNYFVSEEFYTDFYVEAIELAEDPVLYFPYSELDPYGIQTIFNENISLELSHEIFFEISRMMRDYPNDALEYDNQYYKLHLYFVVDSDRVDSDRVDSDRVDSDRVDPSGPFLFILTYVLYFVSSLSVLLIVAILIVKIGVCFKKYFLDLEL